jgi:HAD superfamily hydrolase (TIGR01459 family)
VLEGSLPGRGGKLYIDAADGNTKGGGMTLPAILDRAGPLLAAYDVLFCDIWGVVHNGRVAYAGANEALPRYRAGGGKVVLVSNAPMTAPAVARLLDDKGVRREAWDAIVSSGDIALRHIAERGYRRLHRIGPELRDISFFEGLPGPHADLTEADAIACTGLVDDRREQPEQYRPLLEAARARELPFVCANPDLAVDVGHLRLPCAGALATLYEGIGGAVFWAGKPHRSAYSAAHDEARRLAGGEVAPAKILAIGDSVRTDLAGAASYGIDALLIGQGLHREVLMPGGTIDAAALARLLDETGARPVAVMTGLAC